MFLVKGGEDLRLDQRIEQVINRVTALQALILQTIMTCKEFVSLD